MTSSLPAITDNGTASGRRIFKEDTYSDALTHHYGKLLHMSRNLVGHPTERECVMLEKIRKLETELEDERQLQSTDWDPIRARVDGSRSASQRDCDIQINIYGLETSMQSVATMDSAFSAMLTAAKSEIMDVEETFRNRVSIGAPNFGKNRRQAGQSLRGGGGHANARGGQKSSFKKIGASASTGKLQKLNSNKPELAQNQMKRLTGGTQLPHVHLKQTPAAKNQTWGFPVFYTPGDYGPEAEQKRERALRAEQLRTNGEQLRMHEEEEEQRAISRLIESEGREADYEKFVILADRFGPLDGELFCMSKRPGKLYEHLTYASATLLQIWWKIMYPHRRVVKVEAALVLQRVYRGKQGRQRYLLLRRYEDNVGVMMRRIMNRALHLTWSKWHEYTEQRGGAKKLIRRIMNRVTSYTFDLWHNMTTESIQERNEKLRLAMARMLNRKMYRIFHCWESDWQSVKRVKNMMRRNMMGQLHRMFEDWKHAASNEKQHRIENDAASFLQRVWRGHHGYVNFQQKYIVTSSACVAIGRIVRGHLARRCVDAIKRTEQRRLRREARTVRREARRAELESRWDQEKARLVEESKVLHAAELIAIREFNKKTRRIRAVRNELKLRTKLIIRQHSEETGGKMSNNEANHTALMQLQSDAVEHSRDNARRLFRIDHPVIIQDGEEFEEEEEEEL